MTLQTTANNLRTFPSKTHNDAPAKTAQYNDFALPVRNGETIMKTLTAKKATLLLATAATIAVPQLANADVVYLNNQPLATSVAPVTKNYRTLVPMRDIFEALGAQVTYNAALRSITGMRGTTNVSLQLGSRQAFINNQPVTLDVAPYTLSGSTLVPMRFVAESLGAEVSYDVNRRIAFVNTTGGALAQNPATGGTQVAGVRTISVPTGVVVPVTLDTELNSRTARKGDTFTATVISKQPGDSEFPSGTRLEGIVREARAKSGNQPGVLDLAFTAAVLPDGTRYQLASQLVDISDKNQVDDDSRGRLTATNRSRSSSDRLKVIGIGAAAGYVLGKVILKKNGVLSGVLGALGGFLYDSSKNKSGVREATLPAGSELGVRLDRPVTYADSGGYNAVRTTYTTS